MPNWKKVITSGSDAALNSLTISDSINAIGSITGSDVYIDQWGSISASLASISGSASSIPTLQQVTDQGNSTTNQLLISDGTAANPSITFSNEGGTPNTGIFRSSENVLGLSAGGTDYLIDGASIKRNTIGGFYINVAGTTAAAPMYSFNSYSSTGMFRPTGVNELAFSTAGSEALRIDSSGNVGIGTTSPTNKLDILANISGAGGINIINTNTGNSSYSTITVNNGTIGYGGALNYIPPTYTAFPVLSNYVDLAAYSQTNGFIIRSVNPD